jgi:hypothetical protein
MSRRRDATEAVVNATVGLAVSWAFTFVALPLWGLHPTAADATGITAAFFALSTARAYVLRRIFRGGEK